MERMSLRELAFPIINAIDSFNYLLKAHHRRTAVVAYHIGRHLGISPNELFELVVAAGVHDVGALSVQERDTLIKEDVENPTPHCIMGHRMLSTFGAFETIGQIIKHHHIRYGKSQDMEPGEVPFSSHIVHFADRVDILINPDEFILNQKDRVTEKLGNKVGTVFHPEVFEAFKEVSKTDVFWIEINNLDMKQLFNRLDVSVDFELSIDNVVDFSLMLSRIIDFRSHFTAAHSYTVAHLASLLGSWFGFDGEGQKKLLVGGYLHDIGKLGIDPGLIEKNGPLTDEEYNMVKLHAYYTAQILNELGSSEWFAEIVTWAARHHEKNDGTGYPMAVTDADLDAGAKIIAFSDVISALMEDRPYREGLSIDIAFGILRDKIASSLSYEMYEEIEQHKDEISDLVRQCHKFGKGTIEEAAAASAA